MIDDTKSFWDIYKKKDFWIVSVFRIKYGFRIVKAFNMFIGKGMVNDHWIVCVFGIASVFGM